MMPAAKIDPPPRTPLFVLPDLNYEPGPAPRPRMRIESLDAFYGKAQVLKGVTLPIADRHVTAIIGPSGCGKSTLLRCLNRMHELTPGATARGTVLLDDQNVYGPRINAVRLRRHVGMVFQKPNPFPSMTIRENVLAGFRLNGIRPAVPDEVVERALRQAALWDEVKDVLNRGGATLSGGQQQRLCIARALALEPQVLLMDEPCSALDPIATARIEELIRDLRERVTVVIVTHNMQQAARVSQYTAFMYQGELVEHGPTQEVFTRPTHKRTEDYVAGRFG